MDALRLDPKATKVNGKACIVFGELWSQPLENSTQRTVNAAQGIQEGAAQRRQSSEEAADLREP